MKMDRRFFAESLVVSWHSLGHRAAGARRHHQRHRVRRVVHRQGRRINLAGSLRMQSYWITVQVLRSATSAAAGELQHAITEFERASIARCSRRRASDTPTPRRRLRPRRSRWSSTLKPEVSRAVTRARRRATRSSRAWRLRMDVDRLVYCSSTTWNSASRPAPDPGRGAVRDRRGDVRRALSHARAVIVPLGDLLQCARACAWATSPSARHSGEDELASSASRSITWWRPVAQLCHAGGAVQRKRAAGTHQRVAGSPVQHTRTLAENRSRRPRLTVSCRHRARHRTQAAPSARARTHRRGFPVALHAGSEQAKSWCQQERCYECFGARANPARASSAARERMLSVRCQRRQALRRDAAAAAPACSSRTGN